MRAREEMKLEVNEGYCFVGKRKQKAKRGRQDKTEAKFLIRSI